MEALCHRNECGTNERWPVIRFLQADGAEQEKLRLPPRRRLSRHHRHAEEVPRLPFRKMPEHGHETRR